MIEFSISHKRKDITAILKIFSVKNKITEKEIMKMLSENKQTTLRNVIETFEVPKINAYKMLSKMAAENKIIKERSYPNIYKLR